MAMTNGRTPTEQVEGVVQAVNATGLKLGGAWLNVSQYGPRLELPDAGSQIRAQIDSRGYIKTLEVLESNTSEKSDSNASEMSHSPRDERITRLEVLRAAAEFVGLWGQTREDVRSEHVLVLAERWLAWVEA